MKFDTHGLNCVKLCFLPFFVKRYLHERTHYILFLKWKLVFELSVFILKLIQTDGPTNIHPDFC